MRISERLYVAFASFLYMACRHASAVSVVVVIVVVVLVVVLIVVVAINNIVVVILSGRPIPPVLIEPLMPPHGPLIRADDELAEELVAQAIEVEPVELGGRRALFEVFFFRTNVSNNV